MREMKDSGVYWIGDIPEKWNLLPVKRFFRAEKRIVGNAVNEYERLALTMKGVIKRSKDDSEGLQPEKFEGYQILRENELVFKLIDLENVKTSRVGLSSYTGLVSPAYIVLSNNQQDNRFYYYWFMFMYYNEVFNQLGGAGVRSALSAKDVCLLPVPSISHDEQRKIADYLDDKCSKIDMIIEKQEKIIEKLKEYRTSFITEKVTKGLNLNQKYQDSGLDWAGQIPDTWRVTRINRIGKTTSGATPLRNKDEEFFQDANVRWVRTLDLNDWLVTDSSEKITDVALNSSSCNIMPIDTVCVAMYGGAGTIGKCGILKAESATNQAVCSIVLYNDVIPEYLLFQLIALRKFWMKFAVGTRKDPNISQDTVGRMPILIPSIKEQESIVNFIIPFCEKIDRNIDFRSTLIKKYNAYKKSLIYECVTGKKEVC